MKKVILLLYFLIIILINFNINAQVISGPSNPTVNSIPVFQNKKQVTNSLVTIDSQGNVITPGLINGASTNSNEFWVSTNANTLNLGTISQPFDGSTQVKFDAVLSNMRNFIHPTLHIMAGLYQTLGANNDPVNFEQNVFDGERIEGAGMGRTILQLTSSAGTQDALLGSGDQAFVTNTVISGLTLDCNYTSGVITSYGIIINGTQNTIRNVEVINTAFYDTTTTEVFGIIIGNNAGNNFTGHSINSYNNLIEGCKFYNYISGTNAGGGVTGPLYGFVTGIGFSGLGTDSSNMISGIIRNNYVAAPNGFLGAFVGINALSANGNNVQISENYVWGATDAIYGDTSGLTVSNLLISHNMLFNVYRGVFPAAPSYQNITICYNIISLSNTTNGLSPQRYGVILSGQGATATYTNINVMGNTVDLLGGPVNSSDEFIVGAHIYGLNLYNNTMTTSMLGQMFLQDPSYNINIYNNYDFNGNNIFNTTTPTWFINSTNPIVSQNTNCAIDFSKPVEKFTATNNLNWQYSTNASTFYREKIFWIKGSSNNYKMNFNTNWIPYGAATTNGFPLGNSNGWFILSVTSLGQGETNVAYSIALPNN